MSPDTERCECPSPAHCLEATGGEQGLTADELEIVRLRRELGEAKAEHERLRSELDLERGQRKSDLLQDLAAARVALRDLGRAGGARGSVMSTHEIEYDRRKETRSWPHMVPGLVEYDLARAAADALAHGLGRVQVVVPRPRTGRRRMRVFGGFDDVKPLWGEVCAENCDRHTVVWVDARKLLDWLQTYTGIRVELGGGR